MKCEWRCKCCPIRADRKPQWRKRAGTDCTEAGNAEAKAVVTVKGDPAVDPGSSKNPDAGKTDGKSDGTSNVKTGDESSVELYAILCVACIGVIGVVVFVRRKKK